jgi:hypothetical protein
MLFSTQWSRSLSLCCLPLHGSAVVAPRRFHFTTANDGAMLKVTELFSTGPFYCQCLSREIEWRCTLFYTPDSIGGGWNRQIHSFKGTSTYFWPCSVCVCVYLNVFRCALFSVTPRHCLASRLEHGGHRALRSPTDVGEWERGRDRGRDCIKAERVGHIFRKEGRQTDVGLNQLQMLLHCLFIAGLFIILKVWSRV